ALRRLCSSGKAFRPSAFADLIAVGYQTRAPSCPHPILALARVVGSESANQARLFALRLWPAAPVLRVARAHIHALPRGRLPWRGPAAISTMVRANVVGSGGRLVLR